MCSLPLNNCTNLINKDMFDFMNERNKTGSKLHIGSVRRSALEWWDSLTERRKNTEIRQTFGEGEPWEDNTTITDGDIETMYMRK